MGRVPELDRNRQERCSSTEGYGRGMFRVAPSLDLKKLEAIFRHKVFKMLLAKGRITKDLIDMLSSWCHSGFQVFCGQRLFPQDETAMENLARSILRASFSQERMEDLAESSKVVYRAKDETEKKVFDAPVSSTGQALEWLVPLAGYSHIPDRGSPADSGSTVLWVLQSRVSRDLPGKTERNRRRRGPLHPGSR